MDYDERAIRDFLRGRPNQFVSVRVIGRRVGGKRRYLHNPQWAADILTGMLEKGTVEMDAQGQYRLKEVVPDDRGSRVWMSPQVKRILEQSAKDFSKVIPGDFDDEDLS